MEAINFDLAIRSAIRRAQQWTAEWQRPIHESGLGWEDGDRCSLACDGRLEVRPVENCSCFINPPCGACTSNYPVCNECGRVAEPEDEAPSPLPANAGRYRSLCPGLAEWVPSRPSMDMGDGKRIFDYDYDSSSGSTMEFRGRYEGPVTPEDIVRALGDGTFGHNGPAIYTNGTFTYTKITD